ncbi:MAG: hypothetical protein AABZ53_00745 [Planctomycetota bacterium]
MSCIRHTSALTLASLGMTLSLAGGAAFADDGISIGHDGAGRLAAEINVEQPHPIVPSVFPGIEGFATGEFGFTNVEHNEPEHGHFMLELSADIRARLVSCDEGIQVYNGLSVLAVGQEMNFGPPSFDYHPVFNIPVGVRGQVYSMTFVARDASGLYAESELIEITFFVNPCPADFNCDGAVDFFDYDDFVVCFEGGACPAGTTADFDGDSTVDFFDYDAFVVAFETPC